MREILGSYLRRIREEQHLLLNDVHKKSGISTEYLIHLEDGTIKRPFPVFLHKLAEFYDVSYEYLRELAGYPPVKIEIHPKEFSTIFKSDTLFKDLTDEEKHHVLEHIEILKAMRTKKSA